MMRSAKELENYRLHARDGEIGSVKGFYLDEEEWTIRYLIVDAGSWLTSRKVLLSPSVVTGTNWGERTFNINLSKEEVKNSPEVDTTKPVPRRYEMALNDYYGWPYYWGGSTVAAVPSAFGAPGLSTTVESAIEERAVIHGTHEAMGFHIEATDGDIGHVEDFLFDDTSWRVGYLVIDTRNWWPGKKVLVSPLWIQDIRWSESRIVVDLNRDTIKAGPEYDSSKAPGPEYFTRLHDHYGKERLTLH